MCVCVYTCVCGHVWVCVPNPGLLSYCTFVVQHWEKLPMSSSTILSINLCFSQLNTLWDLSDPNVYVVYRHVNSLNLNKATFILRIGWMICYETEWDYRIPYCSLSSHFGKTIKYTRENNYNTYATLFHFLHWLWFWQKKYNIICILRRETKVPGVTWHRNHFNCAMVGDRPEKTTTYQTHPRSRLTCYTYEQRPLANIQYVLLLDQGLWFPTHQPNFPLYLFHFSYM